MPERRHLAPGLGENAAELLPAGPANEIGEIVLEKHDADDVLEELRVRVRFQALLADKRADAGDVGLLVSGPSHDVAHAPGMKLLELLPPAQIADTALRVAPARGGPTLDMLAARGNAQELGGSGRHAGERGAHALRINLLGRLEAAVDLDSIG